MMRSTFFKKENQIVIAQSEQELSTEAVERLSWLLDAELVNTTEISNQYVGPRKEMISPWSTNAVEIAENCGVKGIKRIECFTLEKDVQIFDPMLEQKYEGLSASSLDINHKPEPVINVENIKEFNEEACLALSEEEIKFLENASLKLERPLTDCELFGFAQINSEHCRHKIFNGQFVIDGKEKPKSLFQLIKDTSANAPENLVSAYKDNVAFTKGPKIKQFAPKEVNGADYFEIKEIESVLSLKAETHNFPTTVEPFYGASTGGGGEIRDRMAGGRGSIPLIGSAVYMTAYSRLSESAESDFQKKIPARKWMYQTPQQILTKASNGASDFGNKFGQPLVLGSVLTFEGQIEDSVSAYDRTIMLAGGVGYANKNYALKGKSSVGDCLVVLGGDNYRIGMAGGSVSSVDSGSASRDVELSAVQRANPEMQKRVYNVVRALAERSNNPIKLIHDHGAGGHINCLGELVEELGGKIQIRKLPIGDQTLSVKEIICNESQERMGLIVAPEDLELVERICLRERAPFYVVGEITGDKKFIFEDESGETPVNLPLSFLFESSPKTVLEDQSGTVLGQSIPVQISNAEDFEKDLLAILSLEGVASKDWLTNKVDRSVSGLVALQQCAGVRQIPVNNCAVVALDYAGTAGIATSIGHSSIVGLSDAEAGAVLSVAEACTNIVFAPLKDGLSAVALSANWMWPAKQKSENARLYSAVEALSKFCIDLGVAVPTGKDSLSMTMRYPDGQEVKAPGTVIVSAMGECVDIRNCVTPVLDNRKNTKLLYVNLSGLENNPLGGSAYAQTKGVAVCGDVPTIASAENFKNGFNVIQQLIKENQILSGHDVSYGGLITTLLEMSLAGNCGLNITPKGANLIEQAEFLFCEKPAVVLQVEESAVQNIAKRFSEIGIETFDLGSPQDMELCLAGAIGFKKQVTELLNAWSKPSYLLDCKQTKKAKERYENLANNKLEFSFPAEFSGKCSDYGIELNERKSSGIKAGIIREKGTNGDREMAFSLYAAGFDVKDITMSDLMRGEENLEDLNLIVFPGGFSNSDVLGAGRGWAGAVKFNPNVKQVLDNFFKRPDTLSLSVCNGCQFISLLDYLDPKNQFDMLGNASGKFESSFLNVKIEKSNNVFLEKLAGSTLGIWVAHGEGQFKLHGSESAYNVAMRYDSSFYPRNPNGSAGDIAALSSPDGRHLAMMPHLERSVFPWQWGCYPSELKSTHEISPWLVAFASARDWVLKNKK